jgi:hypothetical protein
MTASVTSHLLVETRRDLQPASPLAEGAEQFGEITAPAEVAAVDSRGTSAKNLAPFRQSDVHPRRRRLRLQRQHKSAAVHLGV